MVTNSCCCLLQFQDKIKFSNYFEEESDEQSSDENTVGDAGSNFSCFYIFFYCNILYAYIIFLLICNILKRDVKLNSI